MQVLHQRAPCAPCRHPARRLLPAPAISAAHPASRSRRSLAVMASTKPQIMVNSVAGKMGQAVAEAALRANLELVPFTLCPQEVADRTKHIAVGSHQIATLGPAQRDQAVEQLKAQYPNLIVVDYTVPDVVNEMADFYIKHRLPFVMGTTGGDRARLLSGVEQAKLHAVIAPNMGKQIVAFQAMFEMAAATFPGAFSSYKLRVVESHQSTKKDTSGTAKAVVASLNELGLRFDVSQIELVREPKEQLSRMHVPESALNGHAYHTYQLTSPDGSVMFEFQHNVVGRTTYAEGTVDACLFLQSQIEAKSQRTLFNMVDVLKAGAMR